MCELLQKEEQICANSCHGESLSVTNVVNESKEGAYRSKLFPTAEHTSLGAYPPNRSQGGSISVQPDAKERAYQYKLSLRLNLM